MNIDFEAYDVKINPYDGRFINVSTEITDAEAYYVAKNIMESLSFRDRQTLLQEFDEDIRNIGYI